MKKQSVVIILAAGCMVLFGTCTGPKGDKSKKYYVSPSGNDDHPGTERQPFRSIIRINQLDLGPGDVVCFEGGRIFRGTLVLDSLDSGDNTRPVKISSYGQGGAVLDGGNGPALRLEGCSYLTVQNLECRGDGRKDGNTDDGIHISGGKFISIEDLEVSGFRKSGIRIHACDHVRLTRVFSHDNGFAGICVTGTTGDDPVNYDNHDLYLGYCVAENNPGDPAELNGRSGNGILVSSVAKGLLEYCTAANNGGDSQWLQGPGSEGLAVSDSREIILQHCISHDNHTIPGGHDGGGFVFDGGTSNSIIQYCISYRNDGAGYGLFEHGAAKPWGNNIIRYNISRDDGLVNHYACVGIWKIEDLGVMSNCEVYNNTFYNSNPDGSALWIWEDYPGFNFRNNVFLYEGPFIWESRKLKTVKFLGNCYWNLEGNPGIQGYPGLEEWARATGNEMMDGMLAGVSADPMLEDPGTLSVTVPERIDGESLSPCRPKPGSPLIVRGIDLREVIGVGQEFLDIVGTRVPQGTAFDIGALEYVNK